MDKTVADLRKDYTLEGLSELEVDLNPFIQFKKWFDQALARSTPRTQCYDSCYRHTRR